MKKRPSSLPIVVLLLLIGGGWAWQHYYYQRPAEKIAAGTPLDQTHSRIDVLSPTTEEPASTLPTDTSSSAIIGEPGAAPIVLTSATIITTPPVTPLVPALDEARFKKIRLGVALSMLAQAYATGGPQALSMLASIAPLADGALAQKIAALRTATPANGPLTPALLLAEAQRVKALGNPNGAADAEPVAGTWLRHLITVRSVKPAGSMGWDQACDSLVLQLAANDAAGATHLLATAPLATDKRFDDLRVAVKSYLDQAAALNTVLNAYLTELTS